MTGRVAKGIAPVAGALEVLTVPEGSRKAWQQESDVEASISAAHRPILKRGAMQKRNVRLAGEIKHKNTGGPTHWVYGLLVGLFSTCYGVDCLLLCCVCGTGELMMHIEYVSNESIAKILNSGAETNPPLKRLGKP